MAESITPEDSVETEGPARGGSFLFEPVGARPFMTPEKFTDLQRQFYQTGHDFSSREISTRAAILEKKDNPLLRELLVKAGDLGLLGVDISDDFGGLGLDKTTSMLVAESQAQDYGSWSTTFGAHVGIGTLPIVFFGTPAQKAKYLPDLATGKKVAAYALSEAGSGSDALGARTMARLSADGKHYVVNGGKMWITNGGFADVYVVFLQVEKGGFTAVIVERGTPGFSSGREEHKLGIRGSSTTPLIFEDALIPVENVLGEIGKGHKIAFNILNVGRLKLAAFAIGGMKAALQGGIAYAAQRKQFGKLISSFGLIREKLAKSAAQIYAVEAMTYRASGAIDDLIGEKSDAKTVMNAIEEYAIEASIMKVAGSEMLFQTIDEMLQIHGGNGFVEDYPIERAYRDNRVNRIFEGTNEINRLLIPGMVFKRAMKGEMPLFQAVEKLDDELSAPRQGGAGFAGDGRSANARSIGGAGFAGDGRSANARSIGGRLAAERRGAELAKRQFLFAAKWAATLGPALEERQEVLAALADCALEVYAMDSILGRTLATEETALPATGGARMRGASADDRAELRNALCRSYCNESRERAFTRARDALCAVVPADEVGAAISQLGKLHDFIPVNGAEVREQIVPALLESGKYPLAY
jgi:alkylation response protein AidB-like acyl-CoA dehydrogenase